MELTKATRQQAKIKLGIQGCSGSGKTMGALLIAYGLAGDWNRIAVIDTESFSASLYADLGGFSVVGISAPFSPEKYVDAIHLCERQGIEVIILDSISHEWEGIGGILDVHAGMAGNSFTNWGRLTPRHNAFVQAILQSPAHIIATVRTKQDYVLREKNGKQVPEKIGLKGVTRDGMDYELTIVLDLDICHHAQGSKDRTGLFMDKPEFTITPETGKLIRDWCNQGVPPPESVTPAKLVERINACMTVGELCALYAQVPKYHISHSGLFTSRKKELQPNNSSTIIPLNGTNH